MTPCKTKPAQLKNTRFRQSLKSNINNFYLTIAAVFLALALFEAYCRFFLSEISDTYVIQIKNIHNPFHHGPLFKEDEFPKPDSSAIRIAFIGDSFTRGFVELEDTYAHQFESMAAGEFGRIQVFNLGSPSYSPSIYGVVLRRYLPLLKPHIVVFAIDDSDVQDDFLYAPSLIKDSAGLPISAHPVLHGVPNELVPLAEAFKSVRYVLGSLNKWWESKKNYNRIYPDVFKQEHRLGHYYQDKAKVWDAPMRESLKLIGASLAHCRRNGVIPVWINYPYPPLVTLDCCKTFRKSQHLEDSLPKISIFHLLQKQMADSLGVAYKDFTEDFRRSDSTEYLFKDQDGHFSVRGNRFLARVLMRFMRPIILSVKLEKK